MLWLNNGEIVKSKDSYNFSENYRHQCAVRQLILYRRQWGLKAFREYMNKHKEKLDWQLVKDFEEQWLKKNRADQYGEWK